jgi:hypothetical protein
LTSARDVSSATRKTQSLGARALSPYTGRGLACRLGEMVATEWPVLVPVAAESWGRGPFGPRRRDVQQELDQTRAQMAALGGLDVLSIAR